MRKSRYRETIFIPSPIAYNEKSQR